MNWRNVLTDVGMTMIIPGLMALISIPICLIFQEYKAIPGFIYTLIPSMAIGLTSYYYRPKAGFHLFEMIMIISLSWLLVTVVGTIPFLYQGIVTATGEKIHGGMTIFSKPVNAFFETVSGFTSTGLTMVEHESELTHALQWWRSLMQWIGGIGIIVIVTFFHNPRIYSDERYYEKDDFADIIPNPNVQFYKYWWIYLLFTVLAVAMLLMNGLPVWESVNHGMTAIATGGFTITDNSYSGYNASVKLGTIVIMILGSLNFYLFYLMFRKRDFKAFFRNTQVIVFFVLLFLGYGVTLLMNMKTGISMIDSIFQYTSALATCGFQSSNIAHWPVVPVLLLSLVMLIGGTTDSTTGGIKIFRFWIFIKSIFINSSRILFHPKKPLRIHLQEKKFNDPRRNKDLLMDTYIYLLLWLFVYAIGAMLLAYTVQDQYGLKDILFEASSAFGNVGMSTGITGPGLAFPAKLLLILIMFAGRLELMPLMILLGLAFRERKRD